MSYHDSVLLKESVDGLNVAAEGVYVDVTFGGGGHSKEILSRDESCSLFAFDQDEDALNNELDNDRFTLIHSNFAELERNLKLYRAVPVDGILADLGVSSHQFDERNRGFSIREDGPLDMRMGKTVQKNAKQVIQDYSSQELAGIFRAYSDLKGAGKIAFRLKEAMEEGVLNTTGDLVEVLRKIAPRGKENKFLAQVFQALRMEVNDEVEVLKQMLTQALQVLKPGGRLVVISYHSIEDRLVKNFFRSGNFTGEEEKDLFGRSLSPFKVITRKPIIPSDNEIESNSRARSAKMRIVEKL